MSTETRARRVPAAISDEEIRSPTPGLDLTPGIDAPQEDPAEEYSKKLLKIREDYAPDMRLYKKDIHNCVFDDDEDHELFLQRMPSNPADIQYKTSCGYMYCTAANGVFEPGTYRVSIEVNEQPETKGSCDRSIPLEPLQKWSGALAKYPSGVKRRGKGKDAKHWLCLACLEHLWMETTGFAEEGKDKYDLPYIQDLAVLRPENRKQGRNDVAYHLSSPQAYAMEKWCAVMRFNHPYIEWDEAGCIPGLELGTLYTDVESRDLRGIDARTGLIVEVTAAQVKGKCLSDLLAFVDRVIEQIHKGTISGSDEVQAVLAAGILPETTPDSVQVDDDCVPGIVTTPVPISAAATPEPIATEAVQSAPERRKNPPRERKPTRKAAENI